MGHCAGCAKCVTPDWALQSGVFSFLFSFPPPFRLLNPAKSGRELAGYQHYQVDFQQNKSSSLIPYNARGKQNEK